jgi:hypothetical protein
MWSCGSCQLVCGYQCFEGKFCLYPHVIFENGESMLLPNIPIHLKDCMVAQPKTPQSELQPP